MDTNEKNANYTLMQAFLSSAIADITGCIHLMDTKVSIIMGSVIAIDVGIAACYKPIKDLISIIKPCSWIGIVFILLCLFFLLSTVSVFIFGIITVKGHASKINYKSKWFLTQPKDEYSFEKYYSDIQQMNDDDIIKNMAAELYKLNDINRQKSTTMRWEIFFFTLLIITLFFIGIILFISVF